MHLLEWLLGKQKSPASGIPQPRPGLPKDWTDKDAWDRYFSAELLGGHIPSHPDFIVLRFLSFAHEKGAILLSQVPPGVRRRLPRICPRV